MHLLNSTLDCSSQQGAFLQAAMKAELKPKRSRFDIGPNNLVGPDETSVSTAKVDPVCARLSCDVGPATQIKLEYCELVPSLHQRIKSDPAYVDQNGNSFEHPSRPHHVLPLAQFGTGGPNLN